MEDSFTENCQKISPIDYIDEDIRYQFADRVTQQSSDDYVAYRGQPHLRD